VSTTTLSRTLTALREGLGIAFDSLRANKTRAALAILGIAIGVMVVMAMAATVKGINGTVDRILQQTGPTTFYVFRFEGGGQADDDDSDPAWWRYPPITPAERTLLASLASIDAVTMDDQSTWMVTWGPQNAQVSVYGRSPAWPHVNGGDIVAGRSYSEIEEASGDKVVVLNEKAAESLFGRRDPVGQDVRISGQSYRVIGVYHSPPNLWSSGAGNEAYVPYTSYRRHISLWNSWASLTVRPREGVALRDALDEVTTALRRSRGLRPAEENNFVIFTQDRILEQWNKATGMFFLVMIALSAIGLLVGGIGVIAIMMISVTERTREIGVRKALGATRREILWQFLVEAATLTLVGGVVGMTMGAGAVYLVNALTPLPATVPYWSVVAALGASVITGIVFGIVPASKASRLDPIEALRFE
jgi:putative ABC transport system permease protein